MKENIEVMVKEGQNNQKGDHDEELEIDDNMVIKKVDKAMKRMKWK